MRELESEFCEYLKHGEFHTFMLLWRTQMERLGHIGGRIHVPLNEQNQKDIEGLMGTSYHTNSHAVIAWSTLKKAIAQTRFDGCDFQIVLQLYFQEEIIGRKTRKEQKKEAVAALLQECGTSNGSHQAKKWVQSVLEEKGSTYQRIEQEFDQHPTILKKHLTWVCSAIAGLPVWRNEQESLAVFSSKITGDPHAFDYGSFSSYLVLQAISACLQLSCSMTSNMDKNNVLVQAGLYKDSASNYCMIAHIRGFEAKHILHPAWQAFYERYEIWNVNTANLMNISKMDSAGCARVLVIENPSVFQELVHKARECSYDTLGFVCTNGQLNFCGYQLLDLLSNADILLYYCGDMDPEGLLIADRLKQRYQQALKLWHYECSDYEKARSKKHANSRRLKMLNQIQDEKLKKIGAFLLESPLGYQENLMETYLESLSDLHEMK